MTIKTRANTKAKVPVKTVKAKTVAKKAAPVASKSAKTAAPATRKVDRMDVVDKTPNAQPHQSVDVSGNDQPITGRGVFAVRTLGDAVSVEAAFLAQDGNVLRLPAVFPDRQYALQQIDELREIVIRHFDDLAAGRRN